MKQHPGTDTRREQQIPVDLGQPLELEIHNPVGEVFVRAVDRADVLVAYDSRDAMGDRDDEPKLIIDARGNRIEVRPNQRADVGWAGFTGEIDLESVVGQISRAFRLGGHSSSAKPGNARIGSGGRVWADIAVEIPRSMVGKVKIHAASGDVHVEDVTGEIALHAMSGDLHAVRTAGSLELQAASGDMFVEEASGRLTVRAASGDVRLASAQSNGFDIKTANGDIQIDAVLAGDGPFRAHTVSGNVGLTLRRPAPEGQEPAATLTYQSVSGDARVSSPFRKTGHRRWQSGSGNGGPHVDVTTVNGDLAASIAAAESAFVPAPSPAVFADEGPVPAPAVAPNRPPSAGEVAGVDARAAVPPAAHDDTARLAVLEAVERGEIDVEEALRRLDAEDATANA